MTSSPFLLLITCDQFLFALQDLKQGTRRSSATQIHIISPSFLISSDCGTSCPSMSARWHLTASRLIWASFSSSRCLLALFLSNCTMLFYVAPVYLAVLCTTLTAHKYSLLAVRYYSVLSQHRPWKITMKIIEYIRITLVTLYFRFVSRPVCDEFI